MFPLPISTYIYAGLILISIICFGYGRYEHNNYVAFKTKVEAIAHEQEAHIVSITKQQALVTKGIENEYEAKLSLLRQYYANGVRNTSSGAMPTIPNSSININDFTPNGLLIKCAETTQQLVSLQDWINSQIGIK
jgi:hypothetical protein